MSRRHRRRTMHPAAAISAEPWRAPHAAVTVVPAAPSASRPGIDSEVIGMLQEVDALVRDMRNDLAYPNQAWDEDSSVKRYLLYVSMLVDVVLAELVMSALHSNDVMLTMKMRLLVEYAAKASYFNAHPDYALFMMTIDRANKRVKKLRLAGAQQTYIDNAEKHRDEMVRRFPSVADMKTLTFYEIMTNFGDADDYVWLYGAPSALLHGDPEGADVLIETAPDGSQTLHLTQPLESVNAMLVDAGSNVLLFCDAFLSRFRPRDNAFRSRYTKLHAWVQALVLKHPIGRDDDALEPIRNAAHKT